MKHFKHFWHHLRHRMFYDEDFSDGAFFGALVMNVLWLICMLILGLLGVFGD